MKWNTSLHCHVRTLMSHFKKSRIMTKSPIKYCFQVEFVYARNFQSSVGTAGLQRSNSPTTTHLSSAFPPRGPTYSLLTVATPPPRTLPLPALPPRPPPPPSPPGLKDQKKPSSAEHPCSQTLRPPTRTSPGVSSLPGSPGLLHHHLHHPLGLPGLVGRPAEVGALVGTVGARHLVAGFGGVGRPSLGVALPV